MTTTTRFPRRTPVQQAAMVEAVGTYLGRLPNGLTGRTLDSLMEKGYAYEGDNRGRSYATAQRAGYTGFPNYYLTHTAYQALGVELAYLQCSQCAGGRYAAKTGAAGVYRCTGVDCSHEITVTDLELERSEYVELRHWRLVVLQRNEPTGEPGTDAGECDQCGTVIIWDGTGRRVNDEFGEYICASNRREAGRNPQGTSAVHVPPKVEQPAAAATAPAVEPTPGDDEHQDQAAEPEVAGPAAEVVEVRNLSTTVELDGATYYPDGTQVVRLYDAEGDTTEKYQEMCPCCGTTDTGTTIGMVVTTTDPRPLQRIRFDGGGVQNWEPEHVRPRPLPAIPSQPAPWLRMTIGAARPAFLPQQRS